MTTAEVLVQLSSLKDNSASFAKEPDADPIWNEDIKALEAAIEVFSILEDEGITDTEELKDIIHDYDLTVKTNKEYNRKDGTEQTVEIKFREACGKPDGAKCPMNIIVNKDNCSMSQRQITIEKNGRSKNRL